MTKGFTLIELLIVIGILAILATVVTLVLNPAEMLKQSRDTHRLSDLRTLRGAIDLYLVRVSSQNLASGGDLSCQSGAAQNATWYASQGNLENPIGSGNYGVPVANDPFIFIGAGTSVGINPTNMRSITGNGWMPVALNAIPGGSSIGKLPVDPSPNITKLSTTGQFYAYECAGLTYEINANMESIKYGGALSTHNVENKDGGGRARDGAIVDPVGTPTIANTIYEVGNDPGLDL